MHLKKEKGGFWIGLFLGNLQILLKRVFVLPLDDTVCYNLINILFMISNLTASKIKPGPLLAWVQWV